MSALGSEATFCRISGHTHAINNININAGFTSETSLGIQLKTGEITL